MYEELENIETAGCHELRKQTLIHRCNQPFIYTNLFEKAVIRPTTLTYWFKKKVNIQKK